MWLQNTNKPINYTWNMPYLFFSRYSLFNLFICWYQLAYEFRLTECKPASKLNVIYIHTASRTHTHTHTYSQRTLAQTGTRWILTYHSFESIFIVLIPTNVRVEPLDRGINAVIGPQISTEIIFANFRQIGFCSDFWRRSNKSLIISVICVCLSFACACQICFIRSFFFLLFVSFDIRSMNLY